MAANLYRPVAGVSDLNNDGSSVPVQHNLASCCKSLARYHVSPASVNWVVNAYEFCSIGERCFHLHLRNHLGDAFHHLVAAQHLAAFRHKLSNRLAIARRLQDEIGYERNSLGMIELDASLKPLPSDNRGK